MWVCTCMDNIWNLGVTNIYFQTFQDLCRRLGISPILQVRKRKLREARGGNTSVWGALPVGGVGSWS